MLNKEGQNAITNKRLYPLSWWADIRTSRRRGWCSYIELLSRCHFDLPGRHARYYYGVLSQNLGGPVLKRFRIEILGYTIANRGVLDA